MGPLVPEEVIRAIMARRNPRTGRNYTRDEAEAIYHAKIAKHVKVKHSTTIQPSISGKWHDTAHQELGRKAHG